MQFEVIPLEANLRSAPRVEKKTELARLKQGQLVTSQALTAANGWWPVTANVQGTLINGFMHQSVLRQLAAPAKPGDPSAPPVVPPTPPAQPVFPNQHPRSALDHRDCRAAQPDR